MTLTNYHKVCLVQVTWTSPFTCSMILNKKIYSTSSHPHWVIAWEIISSHCCDLSKSTFILTASNLMFNLSHKTSSLLFKCWNVILASFGAWPVLLIDHFHNLFVEKALVVDKFNHSSTKLWNAMLLLISCTLLFTISCSFYNLSTLTCCPSLSSPITTKLCFMWVKKKLKIDERCNRYISKCV
jgi:hypothetical protein